MAFPTPAGSLGGWSLFANGFTLDMSITNITKDVISGNIRDHGDAAGTTQVAFQGSWDDNLKKLQFSRTVTSTGEQQTFVGYLFDSTPDFTGTSLDTGVADRQYWVFAGRFTSIGGAEPLDRQTEGWGWFGVQPTTSS
ncbi:hypothetical protein QZM22_02010 [Burkholderia oklahomensis]|uniref:hypothetical protein n=1 Tax=Burkholderia oklahomensis TaxID=342113 RepID=UPI0026502773|nr:hypothetical protein [Burkholderia oklahomensis]MDN7671325.1 hypothetical protein [Burkholderia oklahomensis]